MIENIEIITTIAATAIPLFVAIITCFLKLVKSLKFGKEELKQRLWTQFAKEAIECVEVLKSKTSSELMGATKKEIAMNKVESACIKSGIAFDAQKISEIIEGIIKMSKIVNGRDKDKAELPLQNILPLDVNK